MERIITAFTEKRLMFGAMAAVLCGELQSWLYFVIVVRSPGCSLSAVMIMCALH